MMERYYEELESPRYDALSPVAEAKNKYFSSLSKKDHDVYKPTVIYVPNRGTLRGKYPVVSVQQKKNGRYVVVEQKPVHTVHGPQNPELEKLRQKEEYVGADGEIKYKYLKPAWKFSQKGKYIERSFNREFHEPYLPPISDRAGYKEVKSKVRTFEKADHVPGGGNRKIPTFKVHWNAEAKVGSLDNNERSIKSKSYPNSEIASGRSSHSDRRSLQLPELKPHYGARGDGVSFRSYHYTPSTLHDYSSYPSSRTIEAEAKVGSLDNIHYRPKGGETKIKLQFPTNWKSEAKVDSLEKIFHDPTGGDVTIIDMKPKWKALPKINSHNYHYKQHKGEFVVPHFEADWKNMTGSKVKSLDNKDYTPRVNNNKIYQQKLNWKKESKIKQIWKTKYPYDDPNDPSYDEDKIIEERIRQMLESDPELSSRFSEY